MAVPCNDLEPVTEHRFHQVGTKDLRGTSLASHPAIGDDDDP